MKYTIIYTKIANPLDDQTVLEQLIEAYSEPGDFYSALTNRYSKEKQRLNNIQAMDELHASIFNRWKKELLSVTKEQFDDAIKKGLYKRNIYKLLDLLKTIPDVRTKKEADAILNKSYSDKELESAMEEYRWDSIGAYSGWTHISNRHITGKKTINPKVEHRLYINTDTNDVHKMSKIFMDKCIEKNLPFYFKIDEYDCRDDNVVIYSDTKLLPMYLIVLNEIENEYPDMIKRCGRPPVLSGIIRNWIGYGSEPISLSGKESFNTVRAKSIEKAIEEELLEWYRNHKNLQLNENGKTILFTEYIAREVAKTKSKKLYDYRIKYPQNEYIKYTAEDVKSNEFIKRMTKLINEQMPRVFNEYINGKIPSWKPVIDKPVKGDVNTTIYYSDILTELKKFIKVISNYDPNFSKKVRARIEKDAMANGIDPNKYCFDIENVELLKKAEMESGKQVSTKKATPVKKKRDTQKENIPPIQTKKQTDSSVYHRPAGTPTYYKAMTEEEILEAQKKLAECPMVKVKRR